MTRLANDYYLIVHDDRTGRLQVPPDAARFGLATALIAELVLSGHLGVHGDGLYPLSSAVRPDNVLVGEVLRAVGDPGQERHVGMWIRFLAVDALGDVRGRLLTEEVLEARVGRGLLCRKVTHPPVSSNAAAWPGIRLALSLSRCELLAPPDAVLTGIVIATGLLGRVLWDPETHTSGKEHAAEVRANLPPPVQVLLRHAESCVANAVLTALR